MLCFAISEVMTSCAGSLSLDLDLDFARALSEGLVMRLLNESLDWAAIRPWAARRVFGGIVKLDASGQVI